MGASAACARRQLLPYPVAPHARTHPLAHPLAHPHTRPRTHAHAQTGCGAQTEAKAPGLQSPRRRRKWRSTWRRPAAARLSSPSRGVRRVDLGGGGGGEQAWGGVARAFPCGAQLWRCLTPALAGTHLLSSCLPPTHPPRTRAAEGEQGAAGGTLVPGTSSDDSEGEDAAAELRAAAAAVRQRAEANGLVRLCFCVCGGGGGRGGACEHTCACRPLSHVLLSPCQTLPLTHPPAVRVPFRPQKRKASEGPEVIDLLGSSSEDEGGGRPPPPPAARRPAQQQGQQQQAQGQQQQAHVTVQDGRLRVRLPARRTHGQAGALQQQQGQNDHPAHQQQQQQRVQQVPYPPFFLPAPALGVAAAGSVPAASAPQYAYSPTGTPWGWTPLAGVPAPTHGVAAPGGGAAAAAAAQSYVPRALAYAPEFAQASAPGGGAAAAAAAQSYVPRALAFAPGFAQASALLRSRHTAAAWGGGGESGGGSVASLYDRPAAEEFDSFDDLDF